MKALKLLIATAAVALTGFAGSAQAAQVLCQNPAVNHMLVDTAYASACMDAGVGNIGQGNPLQDDWLNSLPVGHGYINEGDQGFTQTEETKTSSKGTFSVDSSLWNSYEDLFIGFKFGTGDQPDEWFVFQLEDDISSGLWQFVNLFEKGGGLSHVTVYGKGVCSINCNPTNVPEPGTLALLGGALFGLFAVARRRV